MVENYKNIDVLNSIQKQVKFRELCFINTVSDSISPVRMISANSVELILRNMESFRFFERNYNIYYSLARFDFAKMNKDLGIPPISFNWEKRKIQKNIFLSNCMKYIINYDFCLDFDFDISAKHKVWDVEVNGFLALYDDVKLVKNQFDIRNIPYSLIFSGRGFYIIVPGMYFWNDVEKPFELISKLAKGLKNVLCIDSIDENIYDFRRVVKCYDTYDVRSGKYCLPLTDDDFDNFDLKNMNVNKNYIRNYSRGSYLRRGDSESFIKYAYEIITSNAHEIITSRGG